MWKARDTQLDRIVAVKIPRKDQLSPEDSEQFLREARAAAQLKHPNIVSVHEIGRTDDTLHIVSDYVQGLSLADRLTGQQHTPREAAELCAKIAAALHYAHGAGVIHRDLKPSNIMLDADGEPHVMDFGLAKRETGEITMTVDGQVLGTPAYMSPEQAKGEAHDADARSDVYSLGVILFELLTGERPFRGNTRMLLNQVVHEEAPSPRKLNGSIPRDLETICLKCLEKETPRRYQSAFELEDDLSRWLRGEPIKAQYTGLMGRTLRWAKRSPIAAIAVAAIVVQFAVLSYVYFGRDGERRPEIVSPHQGEGRPEVTSPELSVSVLIRALVAHAEDLSQSADELYREGQVSPRVVLDGWALATESQLALAALRKAKPFERESAQIHALKTYVERTRGLKQREEEKHQAGIGTITDLTLARWSHADARVHLARAQKDTQAKRAALKEATSEADLLLKARRAEFLAKRSLSAEIPFPAEAAGQMQQVASTVILLLESKVELARLDGDKSAEIQVLKEALETLKELATLFEQGIGNPDPLWWNRIQQGFVRASLSRVQRKPIEEITALQEAIVEAEQLVRAASAEYEAGRTTLVYLINAENTVSQCAMALARKKQDRRAEVAAMDQISGNLERIVLDAEARHEQGFGDGGLMRLEVARARCFQTLAEMKRHSATGVAGVPGATAISGNDPVLYRYLFFAGVWRDYGTEDLRFDMRAMSSTSSFSVHELISQVIERAFGRAVDVELVAWLICEVTRDAPLVRAADLCSSFVQIVWFGKHPQSQPGDTDKFP